MLDESTQACSSPASASNGVAGDHALQPDLQDHPAAATTATTLQFPYYEDGPLRKVHPYNHTYLTYAKARWIGRQILEIFSTEFRDRSKEFYAWAISTGTVMVNGNVVDGSYVIENGDLISNVLHRHEPPILGGKVKIYHRDDENGIWVVEKKASMPIHATGRFRKNTLLEVLKNEYGLEHVNTANRLDRLVSGIMIITTTTPAAQKLGKAFQTPGTVKKEYVARARGCFPEGEVICEEPLLTIDKQIGVNVVHPGGRPSKTIFSRISYDPASDTSVVRCRPVTGRSHQLRVHLQFLGHPIANDPIYSDTEAWGNEGGKGGLFTQPQYRPASESYGEAVSKMVDNLAATFVPPSDGSSETPPQKANGIEPSLESATPSATPAMKDRPKQANGANKPRKEKKDLSDYKKKHPEFNTRKGAALLVDDTLQGGSEVSLVPQAIQAVTHLRKVRDEEDNFARYRDMERPPMPPNLLFTNSIIMNKPKETNRPKTAKRGLKMMTNKEREALAEEARSDELIKLQGENPEYYIERDEQGTYCKVCGTPLLPDPSVDQLSIWLHAIRYYTEEWDYSSPLPDWAREDWQNPAPETAEEGSCEYR